MSTMKSPANSFVYGIVVLRFVPLRSTAWHTNSVFIYDE